jgi:glycosyltransferase involved in cell wall biosynthesis
MWFLFHIKQILKSDIIHFHDFGTLIFWFLPIRLLLFFKKYYITFHGYEGYPIKKSNIFFRKICEKLTRGNICVGDYISKWYNTIPDFIYHAATDLKHDGYYIANPGNILFFGRLEIDTGIMSYIEAIRLFQKNNNTNYTFQICGNGKLKETVLSLLKEYKIPYEYYDFQSEIDHFIQRAKIILTSSYLSILESISRGKPVIAFYNNPLKKDYLMTFPEQDKLFFCTDSVEEISNLMLDICQNPDKYKQIMEYGPEYASKYNWSLVTEKYKLLYDIK